MLSTRPCTTLAAACVRTSPARATRRGPPAREEKPDDRRRPTVAGRRTAPADDQPGAVVVLRRLLPIGRPVRRRTAHPGHPAAARRTRGHARAPVRLLGLLRGSHHAAAARGGGGRHRPRPGPATAAARLSAPSRSAARLSPG